MIDLSWALEAIFHTHASVPRALGVGGRALRPVHMFLEVTYRCNLRCTFCQYLDIIDGRRVPAGPVQGDLSREAIVAAIDDFTGGGLITFSGGEVLMRKDFLPILAHAGTRHRTHMISNGALLTDAVVANLVDLAPDKVWNNGFVLLGVSIEGDEARHDAVVQRPGSWQRTVDGLERLRDRKRERGKSFPKTHFNVVVTADTADDLVYFVDLAARLGVDTVSYLAEHDLVGHSADGRTERIVTPQQGPRGVDPDRLRDELVRCHRRAADVGVQVRLSPHVPIDEYVRHYSDDRELDPHEYVCEAVWSRAVLAANGQFAPGCHYVRDGDARSDRLPEVWNGERFRAFRRTLRSDRVYPGCNGCCNLRYVGPKKHGIDHEAPALRASTA